jgi:hypothetical protein
MNTIDAVRAAICKDASSDSPHEASLIQDEYSALASVWRQLQRLKARIGREKCNALARIDRRHADELADLESKYALVLKMSRV